jgi:hypothetical protein
VGEGGVPLLAEREHSRCRDPETVTFATGRENSQMVAKDSPRPHRANSVGSWQDDRHRNHEEPLGTTDFQSFSRVWAHKMFRRFYRS